MEYNEFKQSKRAAANVNERRRMHNINTGFEALRMFLDIQNKRKLSKAAILRHAVEMIRNLQSENQQLREQNTFMRSLFTGYGIANQSNLYPSLPPIPNIVDRHPENTNGDNNNNQTSVITTSLSSINPRQSTSNTNPDMNVAEFIPSKRQKVIHSPIKRGAFPSNEGAEAETISSQQLYSNTLASPSNVAETTIDIDMPWNLRPSPRRNIVYSPSRRLKVAQTQVSPNTCIETTFTTPSGKQQPSASAAKYDYTYVFESPNTRSRRSMEQKHWADLMTTPESICKFPLRSAKRSLDAIIEAIDQIEKG